MPLHPFEISEFEGFPRECYKFTSDGFDTPYYYTSADEDISIATENYEAVYIRRTRPELSQETRAQQIVISVHRTNEIVQRWIRVAPPKPVFLTIYRFHETDGGTPEVITFWQGKVRGIEFKGNEAEITAQPIDFSFSRIGLRRNYGAICSHQLYDEGCGLDINDWSQTITIESVNGTQLTSNGFGFFVSDNSPVPNGYWVTGFVQVVSSGELRMVTAHGGINNTEVTVLIPFEDINIGDQVLVAAGCDHSFDTCLNKFNNIVNFGGFPFVPGADQNPFTRKLVN